MGYHAIHGNHMVSAYIHVVEMKLYCETKYFGAKYGIPCHTYIHICMYVYMYIKHWILNIPNYKPKTDFIKCLQHVSANCTEKSQTIRCMSLIHTKSKIPCSESSLVLICISLLILPWTVLLCTTQNITVIKIVCIVKFNEWKWCCQCVMWSLVFTVIMPLVFIAPCLMPSHEVLRTTCILCAVLEFVVYFAWYL